MRRSIFGRADRNSVAHFCIRARKCAARDASFSPQIGCCSAHSLNKPVYRHIAQVGGKARRGYAVSRTPSCGEKDAALRQNGRDGSPLSRFRMRWLAFAAKTARPCVAPIVLPRGEHQFGANIPHSWPNRGLRTPPAVVRVCDRGALPDINYDEPTFAPKWRRFAPKWRAPNRWAEPQAELGGQTRGPSYACGGPPIFFRGDFGWTTNYVAPEKPPIWCKCVLKNSHTPYTSLISTLPTP